MILKNTHRIQIAKAFTWRLVASFTTFVISWLVTDSVVIGFVIGVTEAIVKIFLYYGHERAWFHYSTRHGIRS